MKESMERNALESRLPVVSDIPDGIVNSPAGNDACPWYAIRLFATRQEEVAGLLNERGLQYFIPLEYVDFIDKDNRRRRRLRPVVRNLIFLKKTESESNIRRTLSAFPFKLSVIRRSRETPDFYEIPSKQMFEFQMMCNPDIAMRKFLSEEEAKLKEGTEVLVTHGPLKGLSGKLVRSSKKYYLLKEVPGMGIMLKVTRWCCKPVEV